MAVFPSSIPRRLLLVACLMLASVARAQEPVAREPMAQKPAASPAATAQPAAATTPTEAPAAGAVSTPQPAAAPTLSEPGATPFELDGPLVSPAAPEEEPESLGWLLLRTLLMLGAVLASIYLTLNVGLRRLMGLQGASAGRPSVVSVVERVPLDQRRTLFLLKAADEYLLVGGGEGGSLNLLSKLDAEAVERLRSERPPSNVIPLTPFLQKLLSRRNGSPPTSA